MVCLLGKSLPITQSRNPQTKRKSLSSKEELSRRIMHQHLEKMKKKIWQDCKDTQTRKSTAVKYWREVKSYSWTHILYHQVSGTLNVLPSSTKVQTVLDCTVSLFCSLLHSYTSTSLYYNFRNRLGQKLLHNLRLFIFRTHTFEIVWTSPWTVPVLAWHPQTKQRQSRKTDNNHLDTWRVYLNVATLDQLKP